MNLFAAFIFFTRLPLRRLHRVPSERFKHVVPWWPWVGWLTGGVMAATLWLAAQVVSLSAAWLLAIVVRLLITGALHEDGLADFCDGFGGGTSRQRTPDIMKESRIGTYGVLALVVYFLLLWQLPLELPLEVLCLAAVSADTWSKFCAAQLINLLPYARTEQQSKAHAVYSRMTPGEFFVALLGGGLPMAVLLPFPLWVMALAPLAVMFGLSAWMRRRIQGYTGDCCGAVFLLCELSYYLCFSLLWMLL